MTVETTTPPKNTSSGNLFRTKSLQIILTQGAAVTSRIYNLMSKLKRTQKRQPPSSSRDVCEWLHPKDQCVGSGFLFLVSRDDPVRTSKSTFCLIVLLFQVYFILFWYWPVSSRKRGFSRKWKSKVVEKDFLLEKKSISIFFSLWKLRW